MRACGVTNVRRDKYIRGFTLTKLSVLVFIYLAGAPRAGLTVVSPNCATAILTFIVVNDTGIRSAIPYRTHTSLRYTRSRISVPAECMHEGSGAAKTFSRPPAVSRRTKFII